MKPKSEIIEAVAIAMNLNLKEQMKGSDNPYPYDPTSWNAVGGVIDLSELAEVALSEYARQLDVPDNSESGD